MGRLNPDIHFAIAILRRAVMNKPRPFAERKLLSAMIYLYGRTR
jgi:hypothetical protein